MQRLVIAAAGGKLGDVTGQVAQLVEHRTENAGVGSSILPLATLPAQSEYGRTRMSR